MLQISIVLCSNVNQALCPTLGMMTFKLTYPLSPLCLTSFMIVPKENPQKFFVQNASAFRGRLFLSIFFLTVWMKDLCAVVFSLSPVNPLPRSSEKNKNCQIVLNLQSRD